MVVGLVGDAEFLSLVEAGSGVAIGLLVAFGAGPADPVVRVELEGLATVPGDGGYEVFESVAGPVSAMSDACLIEVADARGGACSEVSP